MSDRKYKMVIPVLVHNGSDDGLTESDLIGKTVLGTSIKTDDFNSSVVGYVTRAFKDSEDNLIVLVEIQTSIVEYKFNHRYSGFFKEHAFVSDGEEFNQFVLNIDFGSIRRYEKSVSTALSNLKTELFNN